MKYIELARLAGVSVSTVSKALSGSSEIRPETAAHVMRVAAEHGVQLTRGRCVKINPDELRVTVLVPELISIHYSSLVSDACRLLENKGISASIRICGFDPARTRQVLEELSRERITDGVLSLCSCTATIASPLPTVFLAAQGPDTQDCVHCDMASGINEAVAHLHRLGHRSIAFVGEKRTEEKRLLFEQAMQAQGLPLRPEWSLVIDRRFEEIGYAAVRTLLQLEEQPTACITAYDEVALGMIHAYRANGIQVPQAVSVIGINDIPFSQYSSIPLTTIQTYTNESAHAAVQLLLGRICGTENGPIQHTVLKNRLVERRTTAPPRTEKPSNEQEKRYE